MGVGGGGQGDMLSLLVKSEIEVRGGGGVHFTQRTNKSDEVSVEVPAGVPHGQKNADPQGAPQGPRHRPTVGSYGGALDYMRGTPV